jgi:hypothetical protein
VKIRVRRTGLAAITKIRSKAPKNRLFTAEVYDKRLWDHREFNAEFGPMRIELEVQRMLDFLLKRLGIQPLNAGPPTGVRDPARSGRRLGEFLAHLAWDFRDDGVGEVDGLVGDP